jgi:cytochrome c556
MRKLVFGIFVVLFSQWSTADAAGEIKYRQGVMKVVGGHMASMGAILRGRVHMSNLQMHAQSMADIAKVVPDIFPAGSGKGKTEALPAIWGKPDEFKAGLDKFVKAANEMAEAAGSGDMHAIGPAIKALGGSCKGCHDDFREEHDH